VRSDRGRGRELTDEQKRLLLDIRREKPDVSTAMILRTLEVDGRVEKGSLCTSTLRRFFAEHGLDRVALRAQTSDGRQRLRWQAEHPGALWQGDVCHASPILVRGERLPIRIHALLDDASRYVVAIEARHAEREIDMLAVLIRALRRFGAPDALYLDNGATYRGETLSLACARLGTALVHAKPYDAPARGKMERFWRTLREQCLLFCKDLGSLHDLNVRILAWLDEHYHKAPHGGLMGKTPEQAFTAAPSNVDELDEEKLRRALTVRERRRVRRDNTLAMDGADWETSLHFLAGHLVTVARSHVDADAPPWIEYEDKAYPLSVVDPVKNARRARAPSCLDQPHPARVPFDPPSALVDRAVGRKPSIGRDDEVDQ
jgi:transposase InsO family protein